MAQTNSNDPRLEGLEILAEWIAEAFLEEMSQLPCAENPHLYLKENNNAHKRNQRSSQTTQIGENPTGDKEELPGRIFSRTNELFRMP